jgi:DNA-binding response OmpR family regulator
MEMKKVLLIEDDPFLSSLLKNRFAKEGLEVMHARDGQEALDALQTFKPDIILLDIILPKKSGFEVMEGIRQDPQLQNAPIIIISNLGQPEDVQKGQELGAVEYFIKAKTSIDDLVGNVVSFLGNGGAQQQPPFIQ